MTTLPLCPVPALPRPGRTSRRAMALPDEMGPEHRPRRRGEASEARRIEAGFRILAGEGVYADDNSET